MHLPSYWSIFLVFHEFSKRDVSYNTNRWSSDISGDSMHGAASRWTFSCLDFVNCPGVVLDVHGLGIKVISHRCLKGGDNQFNYLTFHYHCNTNHCCQPVEDLSLHFSWIKNLFLPLGHNSNLSWICTSSVFAASYFPHAAGDIIPWGRIHLVIGGTNSNTPRFGRHLAGRFCEMDCPHHFAKKRMVL